MPQDGAPYRLSDVLLAEYEAIKDDGTERKITFLDQYGAFTSLRGEIAAATAETAAAGDPEAARLRLLYARAHRLDLTALCLSGGGIRSASFALGVIQGLADKKLLSLFDYLSTVSGGGYIGSWLSAWLRWNGDAEDVVRQLRERRDNSDVEPAPIEHLRQYSAYLTPKSGLLSGDLWAPIAIVIRNLLLNWLILVPVIALPMIAVKLITALTHTALFAPNCIVALVALFCLALGGASFRYKLKHLYLVRKSSTPADEDSRFLSGSLVPAVVAGFCFTWIAARQLTPAGGLAKAIPGWPPVVSGETWNFFSHGWPPMVVVALVVYALVWLSLGHAPRLWRRNRGSWIDGKGDQFAWIASAIVWGTLIWLGIYLYDALLAPGLGGPKITVGAVCVKVVTASCGDATVPQTISIDRQLLLGIFGMPWFLLSILLAQTAYTLIRSYSPTGDFEREWLGRAGGWYLLAGLGWIVLASVVLLGPALYRNADLLIANGKTWFTALGAVAGGITALLGKSSLTPASGGAKGWPAISSNVALTIAGPLFAGILLILLSVAFDRIAFGQPLQDAPLLTAALPDADYRSDWLWSLGIAFVLGMVALTADFFVNVNRFSLHAVYRNRLIRAYLGASRNPRKPDGFTGFDSDDNIRLTELWRDNTRRAGPDWRPYHVLNMTLNLASTKNLAWQQRQAMSFIATPRHCGAADLGYRRTAEYGDPGGGISLGTAMAISGAAVSPNMGYHTSPSIAFLLTLLNVRLGWWLGNPGAAGGDPPPGQRWLKQLFSQNRRLAVYAQDAPWFSIKPLLAELFARTNEDSPYVYLSDGGHFEDLGLYEMVRRRCKWIVVCDGDQDAERGFEDLGNAVRKIWIDLGVRVRFTNSPLLQATKDTKPAQVPYYALGTIDYVSDTEVPETTRQGRILYIKPGVRGDEDAGDVIAYSRANPDFPDQSTADQWFDEPQLESYRALGYLTISRIIAAAGGAKLAPSNFAALFELLDSISPATMGPKQPPSEDT